MLKLNAIILLIALSAYSCKKEKESITSTQKSVSTNDNSYSVDYSNPMDYVGQLHNNAVLYALDHLDTIPDTTMTKYLVYQYTDAQTAGPEIPNELSSECSTMINDIVDFIHQSSYEDLSSFDQGLHQFDLDAESLILSERNAIYAMTSVARHSARLWAPEEYNGLAGWSHCPPCIEYRPLTNQEWWNTVAWDAVGETLGVNVSVGANGSITFGIPSSSNNANWGPGIGTAAGVSLMVMLNYMLN